ncbi:hypothetical protein KHS38_04425 [Mucilaginibacter sp. Bleaf8]|uniref:hypothetical protein n=1 Tax=Mucilaginibacter sp. Bleaf8 TaxID=2834430 RepID=UPI001BCD7DBD|nr:hypothetical protein [Mucilaginibacter sp. Bleaf8]MBS7563642.1 hypothetical protein [Mucilaginibacter sp. Bleaf8]
MIITVKEPATHTDIELDAQPEDYNGEQGWRILSPDKDSFVMVEKNGQWNVMDDADINPEFLDAIGKALHPVARYNHLSGSEGV